MLFLQIRQQKRVHPHYSGDEPFYLLKSGGCLLEITVQQALETTAVAGFVLSHLMNGIMNSIEI